MSRKENINAQLKRATEILPKIEKEYKLTESVNKSFVVFSQKNVSFKLYSFSEPLEITGKFYHAPTFSLAKTVPIYVFDCTYRI